MSAKEKFADLKTDILKYASLIEEMVERALSAFIEKNKTPAQAVIDYDERQADIWENKLEEACISFIALFHPEAKVLRFTMMIYKMTSDLERIGDIATSIAKDAYAICDHPVDFPLERYEEMKNITLQMLRTSLEALVEENAEKAIQVIHNDSLINNLRDSIHGDIIRLMNERKGDVLPWLILLSISRHIEKMADIITNIAEEVVYITEGRVIKHHHI
ncbi:phosphate signaling complex protein PhoU [Thermospira aquatica]|uniref:Phosphate-specific transport system accessory protein PhoU n=1 Tax=Thermospira aquatica TaxID=2828656 RepID=A0AAX3BBI1_9SPIR|nr:phosphate signaling complex protein PhoU [Thermospira aquatica]URA09636.1 phosphate signaling complex protein PhoU [Thermospira aquatica]